MPTTTTVYTNFELGGMLEDKGYYDLWPVIVAEENVLLDITNSKDDTFMKKFEQNGFEAEPELRLQKSRKAKANTTEVANKSPRMSDEEAFEYANFTVKRCQRLVKVKDQEEPDKEIFVSFYGDNKGRWTREGELALITDDLMNKWRNLITDHSSERRSVRFMGDGNGRGNQQLQTEVARTGTDSRRPPGSSCSHRIRLPIYWLCGECIRRLRVFKGWTIYSCTRSKRVEVNFIPLPEIDDEDNIIKKRFTVGRFVPRTCVYEISAANLRITPTTRYARPLRTCSFARCRRCTRSWEEIIASSWKVWPRTCSMAPSTPQTPTQRWREDHREFYVMSPLSTTACRPA